MIDIQGLKEPFTQTLLDGKLIAYHDANYEVTADRHEILMRLFREEDNLILFYLHIPYAYPIPENLKKGIQNQFENCLKGKAVNMEFINVGTETQKRSMNFKIAWGANE